MKLFNSHSHTHFSHDGKGSVEELCKKATESKLLGFAVTDHLDCEYSENSDLKTLIKQSFENTKAAQQKYGDRLIISCGIEIGEAVYNPEYANEIISSFDWDVILGSVHAVRYKGFDMPFSLIDFSTWSDSSINNYVRQYFDDMLLTVNTCDFDILTHLTVVLRYIVYKFSKNVDIKEYYPVITEILKKIINLDKTLEINTSGYYDGYLMPDIDIIRLYKNLGGKRICIGSDSHCPENLTMGLTEAAELLKNEGFDTLTYYLNRKPYNFKI